MEKSVYVKIITSFLESPRPFVYTQKGDSMSRIDMDNVQSLKDFPPDKALEFVAINYIERGVLRTVWAQIKDGNLQFGGRAINLKMSPKAQYELDGKSSEFNPEVFDRDKQLLDTIFEKFQSPLTAIYLVTKGDLIPE